MVDASEHLANAHDKRTREQHPSNLAILAASDTWFANLAREARRARIGCKSRCFIA